MILVGLKQDLKEEYINDKEILTKLKSKKSEPISHTEGVKMAKETGCITYIEVCALTDEGIKTLCDLTIKLFLMKKQSYKNCFIQ